MKKVLALIVLVCLGFTLTGCYFNHSVGSNEVGLKMDDGVTINEVAGAGRYTKMNWWAKIKNIDTSSKTISWEDNDVWTKDKQAVTFSVAVTYARKSDNDSIRKMWKDYNAAATSDEELANLVLSRIPRIVKSVTPTVTLDEMIGIAPGGKNRDTLQASISDLLTAELDTCGIQLIDIGVNNIGVDPVYAQKMQDKATASIDKELSAQKTLLLDEQLKQEESQTKIDLEKAKRANLVAEETAKVYETSKEAYELKRLELLKDVVGDTDKIYFIPEGADITLFLGGQTNTTPVALGQ